MNIVKKMLTSFVAGLVEAISVLIASSVSFIFFGTACLWTLDDQCNGSRWRQTTRFLAALQKTKVGGRIKYANSS